MTKQDYKRVKEIRLKPGCGDSAHWVGCNCVNGDVNFLLSVIDKQNQDIKDRAKNKT